MGFTKSGIIASTACVFITTGAQADDLLFVDLSVPNEITISALPGFAAATISDTDDVGFLLAGFFDVTGPGFALGSDVGDLSSAANTTDSSPRLYRSSGNYGLNVYSYTDDPTSDFIAGQVAFSGSATWTLDPATYAMALDNGESGNIFFPADEDDHISNATFLGTWTTIPAPGSLALLGLGGLAAVRRRR